MAAYATSFKNLIQMLIKTHSSESQGQEEAACMHPFKPMQPALKFTNVVITNPAHSYWVYNQQHKWCHHS